MTLPHLVVGDESGTFIEVPELFMAGMNLVKPVSPDENKLTPVAHLTVLPDRVAIGYDPDLKKFVQLREYDGKRVCAVGGILPAEHLRLLRSAFSTILDASRLQPQAYTAVGARDGQYYAAAQTLPDPFPEELQILPGDPDLVRSRSETEKKPLAIQLNSAQSPYYDIFYREKGYTFDNLLNCLHIIRQSGHRPRLCYFTFPGLTDHPEEIKALHQLIEEFSVDMLQLHNLPIDPDWYIDELRLFTLTREQISMQVWLKQLQETFPSLAIGVSRRSPEAFATA